MIVRTWSEERPKDPDTQQLCKLCGWQGAHADWRFSETDPGHTDSFCPKCGKGAGLRTVYAVDSYDVVNGTESDKPMFFPDFVLIKAGCGVLWEHLNQYGVGKVLSKPLPAEQTKQIIANLRKALGPPEPECKKAVLGLTVDWQTYVSACQTAHAVGQRRAYRKIKEKIKVWLGEEDAIDGDPFR